jgi:pre-mRNA-splicing factor 38A
MSIPNDPRKKSNLTISQQHSFDQMIRHRIFQSNYWKEQLFAITTDGIVDKAMELKYIGGTYGPVQKPTRFLCLLLKLLHIQPEKDVIMAFIRNPSYKYVTVLGLTYWRLVGPPKDVYRVLEEFYGDFRRVRVRNKNGSITVTHVDEIADALLTKEIEFDLTLPRIPKRVILEQEEDLEPRVSPLEKELNENLHISEITANDFQNQQMQVEDQDDQASEESKHQAQPESRIKRLIKKQRHEKRKKEREVQTQLNPNSDEYWLAMRDKAGLN